MSKNSSDFLFQLTKSLSKGEKRAFKLFVARHKSGENAKFLKLFNQIDKQDTYNEKKILKKEPSFIPAQFSNLKANLYKQILLSLQNQKPQHNPSMQIRDLVDQSNILYDKCLYRQSFKAIEKAKQLALKNNIPLLRLEIIEFEKKLAPKLTDFRIDGIINDLMQESAEISEQLKSLHHFSNLSLKLYSFYMNIGFIRDHKDFEIVTSFFFSSMPAFKEGQLSFDEKTYLFNSMVGYYFFIQDDERAFEYAKKWVNLFEETPSLITPKTEMYIRAMNNLLISQNKLYRYNEFVETFKKFEEIPTLKNINLTKNIKLLLFKYISTHRINYFFLLGDFKNGVAIIPEIAKQLDEFSSHLGIHHTLIFYYKFASMYFGNSQYQQAVFWLNKIINAQNVDLRSDIQGFARILNLISHFELGNMDLVEHFILSTYRFLRKKEDLHEFQTYIIKFLKALNKIKPEQLTALFKNLHRQMLSLKTKPYEKRTFQYFDIVSWLESKIEHRPVGEIIKEKASKRILG